ncbi:MAG: hypothetical protein J0M29_11120 [Chitinophagales bacterium]|nr:hypothetical protein [Chitinophagales bacterium]
MATMKTWGIIGLLSLFFTGIQAQDVIKLENPGFESEPLSGVVPEGWMNMGSDYETPPDIQPGFFGVNLKAAEGNTYLGLVVRQHNTWEGVGQKLDGWLRKDSTYTFSLYLNRSNTYVSPMRGGGEPVSFVSPTILKIWGYNTRTGKDELLAESLPPGHSNWVKYEFTFTPRNGDYNEIDLMAYYAPGFEQRNGNLLIDNCSDIIMVKQ